MSAFELRESSTFKAICGGTIILKVCARLCDRLYTCRPRNIVPDNVVSDESVRSLMQISVGKRDSINDGDALEVHITGRHDVRLEVRQV